MPTDNSFTIYADLMTHVAPSECIPWTVVLIAECLAIVTVNLVTIIVFLKQRKLQRRGTYLVIHLAMLDLLVGAVSGPLFIEWNMAIFCGLWDYKFNDLGADHVKLAFIILFPFSSLINLAVISIERLHATFCPFNNRVMDKRIYALAICVIWLPTAVWEGLRIVFSHVLFIGYSSHLSICLLVISVSYVSIFIKARRSPRRLQNHVPNHRERKLTVTLLIVTLVSLLTWLPNAVFFLVVVIDNENFWGLSYLSHFHMSVAFIALSLCSSLVNPIIYTMRIREFRVAIWNLFCRTSAKRSNVIVLRPPIHNL
ncbi:sphingosine 1-phosphate receptor 3-like [Oculina patagonica]